MAVSKALFADKALVNRLQAALARVGEALKKQPDLLPAHFTSFVTQNNDFNDFYRPIRDAGLATGKQQRK